MITSESLFEPSKSISKLRFSKFLKIEPLCTLSRTLSGIEKWMIFSLSASQFSLKHFTEKQRQQQRQQNFLVAPKTTAKQSLPYQLQQSS